MHFIELERFGWNWLTASFVCLTIITSWQFRSFALQALKVWRMRTSLSVSNAQVTSMFFVTVASLEYGLITGTLVITYTGILALPSLFITLGVWRFGTPRTFDKTVLGISVAGVILLPINPQIAFSGFMVGAAIPLLDQMRELLRQKTRGALHGEFLLTLVVKNALLNVFAFSAAEPVYMIFLPLYLGVTLVLLGLWLHYRPATGKKGLA